MIRALEQIHDRSLASVVCNCKMNSLPWMGIAALIVVRGARSGGDRCTEPAVIDHERVAVALASARVAPHGVRTIISPRKPYRFRYRNGITRHSAEKRGPRAARSRSHGALSRAANRPASTALVDLPVLVGHRPIGDLPSRDDLYDEVFER